MEKMHCGASYSTSNKLLLPSSYSTNLPEICGSERWCPTFVVGSERLFTITASDGAACVIFFYHPLKVIVHFVVIHRHLHITYIYIIIMHTMHNDKSFLLCRCFHGQITYIYIFFFNCCFTSTDTIWTISDKETRTATLTFIYIQFLSSAGNSYCIAL